MSAFRFSSTLPRATRRLPESLSIYLDFVRFGAAIVVVLSHAWPVLYPLHPLPWPGHQAVAVFFVLSGLVISYAVQRHGLTLSEYALHRCARIWSVAVPALVLSMAASVIVGRHGLSDPTADDILTRMVGSALSLLPLGQLWYVDINPPLDSAFWSLNFELWYYVLFGAWLFLSGVSRAFAVAAIALVVGPKILLLLPIWLFGVAVFHRMPRWPERSALAVFLVTCGLALAFIWFDVSIAIRTAMVARWPGAMAGLGGANEFAGDWVLGVTVAANFAAAACLGRYARPLHIAATPIRAAASISFSLYLYHLPLLAVAVFGLGLDRLPALAFILVSVALLAMVTEQQLPTARRLLRRGLMLFDASGPARR